MRPSGNEAQMTQSTHIAKADYAEWKNKLASLLLIQPSAVSLVYSMIPLTKNGIIKRWNMFGSVSKRR